MKALGFTQQEIDKHQLIMNNPEAIAEFQRTNDANKALAIVKQSEKPSEHTLQDWFSEFCNELPEDAKSLSIALTKFSRFVQSSVDKKKAL